jgi:5-methylcytosine-specific restriction endonuclease McrA
MISKQEIFDYYTKYTSTLYWKIIRQLVINRIKKCEKCDSTINLIVHHKTYVNLFNEFQHLDDLTLLCKECHKKNHKNIKMENEIEIRNGIIEKYINNGIDIENEVEIKLNEMLKKLL